MVLEKHEIPLLEFDSDVEAVLMPNHEELDIHLPEKAVFAFLENYIEEYAETHGAKKLRNLCQQRRFILSMFFPIKVMRFVWRRRLSVRQQQRNLWIG